MASPEQSPENLDVRSNGSKEPRDARRRRELIEATIDSIARSGLSGTTVARVAELAGLSAGIVSFYFQTKDALLLATLEYVDRAFERRQQEAVSRAGDDPVRRLEAMIDVDFDPDVCDPRRIAVWSAFWGEALARDDYQNVCGARERASELRVVRLFEQIARQGNHQHLDPTALGRAFYHLLSSLPETMLEGEEPFDIEGAKATCRGFLSSVFPAEFSNSGAAVARAAAQTPEQAAPAFPALPPWVYHDPEFYELEKEYIFHSQWLLAGHVNQVPEPGDFMTLEAAGERALVIRGQDGELRAFHNVCRHRASRVVRGETGHCARAIVCPYHGWSYDFNGGLRAVPADRTFGKLDKSRLGLAKLELEEWMGFVFVRFGGDGPSVGASMKPFEEEARHFRFSEMEPWGTRNVQVGEFNWKLFAENDAEGYHIPTGHPGLRRLFGTSYYDETDPGAGSRSFSVLQEKESPVWGERAYQRLLPEVGHLPEEYRRAWAYYGLFPTSVLQISPDMVDCYMVLPLDAERCQIQSFAVALPDDRRAMKAARYLNRRITRDVLKEDLEFCRWTNEGIRSSSYQAGLLSTLELGVRQFHEQIRALIPVAGCEESPPVGQIRTRNDELRADG